MSKSASCASLNLKVWNWPRFTFIKSFTRISDFFLFILIRVNQKFSRVSLYLIRFSVHPKQQKAEIHFLGSKLTNREMIVCLGWGLAGEFIISSIYLIRKTNRKEVFHFSCFRFLININSFSPLQTLRTRRRLKNEKSFGSFMLKKIFFINFLWFRDERFRFTYFFARKCWIMRSITFTDSLRSLSNILLNLLSANAPIKVLLIFYKKRSVKTTLKFNPSFRYFIIPSAVLMRSREFYSQLGVFSS